MNGKKGDYEGNDEFKKTKLDNLMAELNIPQELREIIEDSDDEFPLRFKDHHELIEIFSTLEENNLLEI